jgi:hypothetical protein
MRWLRQCPLVRRQHRSIRHQHVLRAADEPFADDEGHRRRRPNCWGSNFLVRRPDNWQIQLHKDPDWRRPTAPVRQCWIGRLPRSRSRLKLSHLPWLAPCKKGSDRGRLSCCTTDAKLSCVAVSQRAASMPTRSGSRYATPAAWQNFRSLRMGISTRSAGTSGCGA